MKYLIIILFIFTPFSFSANAQITRSNWLMGGNGRFAYQMQELDESEISSHSISINPNIGYFIVDKFAIGIRPSFYFAKTTNSGVESKGSTLSVGPFARYYLLPFDQRINLFLEGAYNHRWDLNSDYNDNTVLISTGPVFFLNSIVGIELTFNYEVFNTKGNAVSAKTFSTGIGFQIHLEKEDE